VKIVFCSYLIHKWIDSRQTKTEVINGVFNTYRRIHFIPAKMLCFVIFVCNYLGWPRVGELFGVWDHSAVWPCCYPYLLTYLLTYKDEPS